MAPLPLPPWAPPCTPAPSASLPPGHHPTPPPAPCPCPQLHIEVNGEPVGDSPYPLFFSAPKPAAEGGAAPAPGAAAVPGMPVQPPAGQASLVPLPAPVTTAAGIQVGGAGDRQDSNACAGLLPLLRVQAPQHARPLARLPPRMRQLCCSRRAPAAAGGDCAEHQGRAGADADAAGRGGGGGGPGSKRGAGGRLPRPGRRGAAELAGESTAPPLLPSSAFSACCCHFAAQPAQVPPFCSCARWLSGRADQARLSESQDESRVPHRSARCRFPAGRAPPPPCLCARPSATPQGRCTAPAG